MDVADEGAWLQLAGEIGSPVHGLVTAAAQVTPVGPPGSWPPAEFLRTLQVNVMGTLLPVIALLAALESGKGSIVTFSGGGATGTFLRFDAYATSKAAVVRLTENLAGELKAAGVRVNAVAPGFVATDIHRAAVSAGPERAGSSHYAKAQQALESGEADPPQLAADLVAFLLSDASTDITGKLISARWDPWRDLAFQHRLRSEPDLAALRRIDDQFFVPVRS
jgi:3-oxoacyl-[acyl-carrier protein] reductase